MILLTAANEEKERRRAEILDAAEAVAAAEGWEDMTMDQVARRARLSRALLYVYFTDKTDLMFGVGERAMSILCAALHRKRGAAHARHRPARGDRSRLRGICAGVSGVFWRAGALRAAPPARCETRRATKPNAPAWRCAAGPAGASTLETGMRDGSIRADAGHPAAVAIVLWGFLHGVIQLAASKANLVGRRGVNIRNLLDQGLLMATRSVARRRR